MGTNFYINEISEAKMGTNFYINEISEATHIGKSSLGWCFLFQGPCPGLNRLPDGDPWPESKVEWEKVLRKPGSKILDEYGFSMSVDDFFDFVDNREHKKSHLFEYPADGYYDSEGYSFMTLVFS